MSPQKLSSRRDTFLGFQPPAVGDEEVAAVHAVVVVDEDPCHLATDARGDEGDMAVHVGVVGRDGVERFDGPRNAEPQDERQAHDARAGNHELPPPAHLLLLRRDRLACLFSRLVLLGHGGTSSR